MEGIYQNLSQVQPTRLQTSLADCIHLAALSKQLVTINQHLELPDVQSVPDDLVLQDADAKAIADLFEELEFPSLKVLAQDLKILP